MSAFDVFWAAYPRRIGKGAALRAWEKASKQGALPGVIIAGAVAYRDDPVRRRNAIEFTAYPATWLNQQRWLDEPPDVTPEPAPELRLRYTDLPEGIDFVEFLADNPDMAERISNLIPKPGMELNPINAGLSVLIRGFV